MKKIIALVLCCALLLSGCVAKENNGSDGLEFINIPESSVEFTSLQDPALLLHVEDEIYSSLESMYAQDNLIVEQVVATYISKEYVEELDYNSRENIYFGYTLTELFEQFENKPYVFALNENGETIVQEVEKYDDTYDRIIQNVAVGTGVILICVTVSVVTAGVGTGAISAVFAASAKTALQFAGSSGVISGVTAGFTEYIQTGGFNSAVKAAALQGSESFKWSAIIGSVAGGTSKALSLYRATKTIPTPQQSEIRALSKYTGEEQVSFLNGKQVSSSVANATRPDIVRYNDGILEAIEVKNYNLASSSSRNTLYKELERQVTNRVTHLPKNSTQRVVLDVKGRDFSEELINQVINNIKSRCEHVYHDIPVDIMR